MRLSAISAVSLAATLSICGAAQATTIGNTGGLAGPDEVLQVMGFSPGLENFFATPPTAITYTNALYSYIKNDYIGVVVGYDGTYSTPVDATDTVEHHSGGMIAIGNQKGSLLTGLDDLQALCGLSTFEFSATTNPPVPLGYGTWPIPGWMEFGTGVIEVDYCAYMRAMVDGVVTNIVGSTPANDLVEPRFENNNLEARYMLLAGTGTTPAGGGSAGIGSLPPVTQPDVTLDQVIDLYRATAQFHWRLYNGDSTAHTVTLRFTVPIRDNGYSGISPTDTYYYIDPILGQTMQASVIPGASLPAVSTIYGQRYDDPTNTAVAPFAAKTIFSGYGATTPNMVWMSDAFDVYANNTGFYQGDTTNVRSVMGIGIAESLYFGTYSLQPGATQDIYTYYGNGRPTEDLESDVVVGTEADESLQFNSAAALDPKIMGNQQVVTDPTQLAYAEEAFLSPNPINVEASVYNRTLKTNQTQLTNVSMSLILPTGLVFATVPTTNKIDTQTKSVGTVVGDTDAIESWYIQADGTVSGLVNYQMVTASTEIGARSVTRQMSIPAVPLHPVTNTSFQLLGFPFQFDAAATNNSDPATIINTLSPASLRDTPAVFYQWVPNSDGQGGDNGSYKIATAITPGQGYFYRPAATKVIFPYGAEPVSGQTPITTAAAQTTSLVQVPLSPGWNMITDPYLYSIPLSLVTISQLVNGTLDGTSSTFLGAVNANVILGSVFYYDTTAGAYDFFDFQSDQPTPELNPWTGYWIYAESSATLTFTLPTTYDSYIQPDSSGGTPATRGVIARSAWAVKAPTMSNWTLQLSAQIKNGYSDNAAIIGVAPTVATKSAMLPKPPPPNSDYVYIGLVNPATVGVTATTATAKLQANARYAQIMQQSSATAKTWYFDVTSDKAENVTLTWPNMATMPRQLDLTLTNTSTGAKYSLRGRSSLTIPVKAATATRFEMVASTEVSAPLAITLARLAVTRTNSRAVGVLGGDLVFNLTQAAEVTATITNLHGKVVSTLASSRAATVGENHLAWTGKSDNGSALPVGPYWVHIVARTASGEPAEQTLPYTVTR